MIMMGDVAMFTAGGGQGMNTGLSMRGAREILAGVVSTTDGLCARSL